MLLFVHFFFEKQIFATRLIKLVLSLPPKLKRAFYPLSPPLPISHPSSLFVPPPLPHPRKTTWMLGIRQPDTAVVDLLRAELLYTALSEVNSKVNIAK